MKNIMNKLIALPRKSKALLAIAIVLTMTFFAMIPTYAWFSSQRKAAEAFKIKYPNSLFINAAHREDRKFFELDEIDVSEGTNRYYVFSVSGESTHMFTLQMAHTNNNGFNYKIYRATESDSSSANAIEYDLHEKASDSDNPAEDENKPENTLVFSETSSKKKYYTLGAMITTPETYLNLVDASNQNEAKKDVNDPYFYETYGTNVNVHKDCVPTYCQVDVTTDPSTKQFCEYFILEVSWGALQQNNKETDLVYLSVTRKN